MSTQKLTVGRITFSKSRFHDDVPMVSGLPLDKKSSEKKQVRNKIPIEKLSDFVVYKKKLPHRRVVKVLHFQYILAECPRCKRWVSAEIDGGLNEIRTCTKYSIKTFCDFCEVTSTYSIHSDQLQNQFIVH